MSAIKLITAPTSEPFNVHDAAAAALIDADLLEDAHTYDLLASLVIASREQAESATRRALMTQTWELYLNEFPYWEINIPFPPLQSITSIKYVDTDGVLQTLSSSLYLVDDKSEPAIITPAYGEVWPTARYQRNAVTIKFVAGYASANLIPAGIKMWMKMRIKDMFDNRSRFTVDERAQMVDIGNDYINGLLDPYRVVTF